MHPSETKFEIEKICVCSQYCTSNQEEFRKKEGQRPQFGLQKTQQNGMKVLTIALQM